MGKPAARMGDTTAHGGTIVLGNPTLLIGKMPASTLGDMHVCPMCTGPVPHVGGPITLGSMGVLLGKKPGARISDLSVCVGPPSMPAVGCFTVLIGEVGSGSQAGSAAAAAAAAAVTKKGPKAIEPFPLGEPPGPSESHEIQVEFTDSAGKPLSGVKYNLTDPDKAELVGASTLDGAARHAGYAKKGSFDLFVPELKNAKWKKPKVKMGEEAEFEVEADVAEGITEAKVVLFEIRGNTRRAVAFLDRPVEGKKVKGKWKPGYSEVEAPEAGSQPEGEATPPPEKPTYEFMCVVDGLVAVSDSLKIADALEIELLDADGEGIADADYEIILPGGEIRTGKLDGSGKAKFEDLEPGGAEVRFPGHLGTGEPTREIVMDEVVITSEEDREIVLDEVAVTAEPEEGAGDTQSSGQNTTATTTSSTTATTTTKPETTEKKTISGKGLKFPLKSRPVQSYHSGARKYGSPRSGGKKKDRLHGGCDLYAPVGTEVYSVADGKVWRVREFYLGTWEITVNHGHFMVRYGELKKNAGPGIFEGASVKKGALLGYVGKLEGLNLSMVHFELYGGTGESALTDHDHGPYYRRKDLLDPTTFLDELET